MRVHDLETYRKMDVTGFTWSVRIWESFGRLRFLSPCGKFGTNLIFGQVPGEFENFIVIGNR